MNVKDLEALYDYSYWANRKLFQLISQLPANRFTQPVAESYGSIRNTLVHALSAEWSWLDRCGDPQRGSRINPDDYPTVFNLNQPQKIGTRGTDFSLSRHGDRLKSVPRFVVPI